MIDRRRFFLSTLAAATVAGARRLAAASDEPEINDDGLHVQPWFMESFLDLREDHAEVTGAGKHFAIFFEQRGCPYCREMHRVNLADKKISGFIEKNFGVLQLNLWGARKVTDFDGEELEERALAKKWRVAFTPTIVFLPDNISPGKSGRDLEVARMPGYFKPFHFMTMFEYVNAGAYEHQGFQRFLQAKLESLKAKGVKPKVWQ